MLASGPPAYPPSNLTYSQIRGGSGGHARDRLRRHVDQPGRRPRAAGARAHARSSSRSPPPACATATCRSCTGSTRCRPRRVRARGRRRRRRGRRGGHPRDAGRPRDHRHARRAAASASTAPTGVRRRAARRSATGASRSPSTASRSTTSPPTSAFAERTVVRDVQCVKIPDDVPLTSAALVGCGVVTGMGAVFNRANVQPRPVGGRVRRRRRRPQRDPGAEGAGRDRRSSPSTPCRTRRRWPSSSAPPTSSTARATTSSTPIVRAPPAQRRAALRGPFNAGGVDWAFDCVAHPAGHVQRARVPRLGGHRRRHRRGRADHRVPRSLRPPHAGRPRHHRLPVRHASRRTATSR